MCRSRREIREKIAELERSGELPGLIEKAVAEAVDEPRMTAIRRVKQLHSCGTATHPMVMVD